MTTALAELMPHVSATSRVPSIAVVDDDPAIRRLLSRSLARTGYHVEGFGSGEAALDAMLSHPPDIVLLDLMLPGMNGLEVLDRLRSDCPYVLVIVLTGHGSVETAVEAMKRGAHDFLTKPFDIERLAIALRNALELLNLSKRVRSLQSALSGQCPFEGVVGADGGLRGTVEMLQKVIATDLTVLLQGESGTGKEVFARVLHQHGPRKDQPFIAINCAALPASILESELFGHERGAFTGADKSRPGKFEAANGGTLFLDEIAEMSREVQAKLLRTLQERTVTRLGSSQARPVDVRIICATNQDLWQLCSGGEFREDLYYRVAVFPVTIPPLREHREDIAPLARHVLEKIDPVTPRGLSPEALETLESYDWPGNVRELQNVMRRASVLADNGPVRVEHLPGHLTPGSSGAGRGLSMPAHAHDARGASAGADQILSLEEVEREHIRRAIETCQGNLSLVARRLGIGRTTLYRKLTRYQLA
jgi:two-component system, NtrC family, response regulator AtoC